MAWLALGIALLSTTGGDVIYDFGYGGSPPFPSLADVFYLGFYPASYLGIVLLVRGRISSFNASLWLDGFTAALAAGALGASAILEVVVSSTHGSPIVVLTNLSYPLGDIVLLSLLVFVFTDHRLAAGPGVAADRSRAAPEHDRRRHLPLPERATAAMSRAASSTCSGRPR